MITIETLKSTDYWTQLKDTAQPWEECQVTSAANWLNALGYYPHTPNIPGTETPMRLPDYINTIANDSEEAKAMAKRFGYTGPPREVHAILAWAINKIMAKDVDHFSTTVSMQEIFFQVAKKRPVIIAGQFTPEGHVVCLTGLVSEQEDIEQATEASEVDMSKIKYGIVADPYGKYHSSNAQKEHYAELGNGYGCHFEISELMHILDQVDEDKKFAHIYAG